MNEQTNGSGNGVALAQEKSEGRPQGPQSTFRVGSDSMKPKYNLETSCMAIFLSTEGRIWGPKDPMAVQGLLRFTGGSWTK